MPEKRKKEKRTSESEGIVPGSFVKLPDSSDPYQFGEYIVDPGSYGIVIAIDRDPEGDVYSLILHLNPYRNDSIRVISVLVLSENVEYVSEDEVYADDKKIYYDLLGAFRSSEEEDL
ncbi:hypothetical protein HYV12_04495 [Candidatus Dojkabacteria bacterium]|nr:hypothetical protein [Candidatus Dojkabacteria bacterium]